MLSDYVTIAYTIKHQKKNKGGGKGLSPPSTGTGPPPDNRTPVIYHTPYSMHAVPFWGSIRIVKKVPSSEISLK